MDKTLEYVWTFANSPLGITLVVALVSWLIAKVATAKPAWMQYKGTLISAIRFAEKAIPDGSPDSGAQRLDLALKYALRVIEQAEGKPPAASLAAVLPAAISEIHNEVYPEANAAKTGPATLAAILDALRKSGGALALCALLPLLACGCFLDPQPVQEARAERAEAVKSYVGNSTNIITFITEAYRLAEYARIDKAYDHDLAVAKTKPSVEAAVAEVLACDKAREAARGVVDAKVTQLKAIAAKAQTDAAIAIKLDEAIREYEAAGVDASAIPGTVDGILGLLKAVGGK